jgi:hypothetical protein
MAAVRMRLRAPSHLTSPAARCFTHALSLAVLPSDMVCPLTSTPHLSSTLAALYCHAAERTRIAEQCGLDLEAITPCEQGTCVPLGAGAGARAGGPSVDVLHTPGHSSGSACLCVRAAGWGAIQMVLSGDTVFPGSCGRLDAPDSSVSGLRSSRPPRPLPCFRARPHEATHPSVRGLPRFTLRALPCMLFSSARRAGGCHVRFARQASRAG